MDSKKNGAFDQISHSARQTAAKTRTCLEKRLLNDCKLSCQFSPF